MGPVGRPAWTGPGSSVCPPPGLLLGPRQVGVPPPGRFWEAGIAGLCGADPTPALCPRYLRAPLRSLAARGQCGNGVGHVERAPETQTCPFGLPPTPLACPACGAALAKQYAPGPRLLAPGLRAALPVLGSLLPQPRTPFPRRAVLREGLTQPGQSRTFTCRLPLQAAGQGHGEPGPP